MSRIKTGRISVGLERRTIERIDSIATSFSDFVSRGEVIDLLVSYVDDHRLDDEIFGVEDEEQRRDGTTNREVAAR